MMKRHARSTLLCLPRSSIGGGQRRERHEIRVMSTYHLEGTNVNVVKGSQINTYIYTYGMRSMCSHAFWAIYFLGFYMFKIHLFPMR